LQLEKIKRGTPSSQQDGDEEMSISDAAHNKPLMSEKLWVEKYQPHSYRELLSDEVCKNVHFSFCYKLNILFLGHK